MVVLSVYPGSCGGKTSNISDPVKPTGRKPACFVHKTTRIVGGTQVQRAEDGSWVVSIQKGVPDLSEFSVHVGLLHLNTSSHTNGLRIANMVCGPEGSNLALLKLAHVAKVIVTLAAYHGILELQLNLDCIWNLSNLSIRAEELSVPEKQTIIKLKRKAIKQTQKKDGKNIEQRATGHEGSLKMVRLPMVNNDKCSQIHNGSLPITETKVCAGGEKDQGVCEKDYGGPLVCQERESKVIIGVSIHGRGCAIARRPAIFVNVAYYSGWIHKVFKYYSDIETTY
ncbi:hypothetical protein NFI96_007260 [Prochilodus magdalenae]|nr:hypothetical protein NFI96_007260 [Prochilodus magdalenae]